MFKKITTTTALSIAFTVTAHAYDPIKLRTTFIQENIDIIKSLKGENSSSEIDSKLEVMQLCLYISQTTTDFSLAKKVYDHTFI